MSAAYYDDERTSVYIGECIAVMRTLPDDSVDSIVTDPPYGLGFMGKAWDDLPPGLDWAVECLRVLKPGGHLLAFGGTRTWHRLAVAVEDAGFEMRDSIAWLYGSGFPKSMDVSKAIDKAAGAKREVVGIDPRYVGMSDRAKRALGGVVHEGTGGTGFSGDPSQITAPATPDAEKWQGWGTALKPAFEPVVVARKPLAKGMTVAANVLAHGTGALNIDATRVGVTDAAYARNHSGDRGHGGTRSEDRDTDIHAGGGSASDKGRWPANVMLDESQAAALDAQTGTLTSGANPARRNGDKFRNAYGTFKGAENEQPRRGVDSGGASRFFYVAKAPTSERPKDQVTGLAHPTVKPLSLMRQLVRLVTPPDGVVLEPFAGSGTTVEACILEGFRVIAIERETDYWPLIAHRIARGNGVL